MPGRNWSSEIWVTGVGCVSAAGPGNAALGALLESGSGALRADPQLGIPTGRAPDPPPLRQVRHLDRTAQFFAMAAEEAWASAGLTGGRDPPSDVAVIEGSSLGSMADLLGTQRASGSHAHTSRPHPSHLVRYMPDAGAMAFAQAHGVEGPVFSVSAGSISGALAILEGYRRLATGEVDLIVAGGSECPVDRDIIGTFQAAGVIADPAECRPFDRHRKGTVLGEGSGALVLEQAGHAVRGARADWPGFSAWVSAPSIPAGPDPGRMAPASGPRPSEPWRRPEQQRLGGSRHMGPGLDPATPRKLAHCTCSSETGWEASP